MRPTASGARSWAPSSSRCRAYRFAAQQITVHGPGPTPRPPGKVPPGSSHIALTWPAPIAAAVAHLSSRGVEIEHGPGPRKAAEVPRRASTSAIPDGSLVEFLSYVA
ncbi:MAG: hypothetical protein DLM61_08940 [Pseudonocardiales bacterium]|nr:MAG: hypothetical protein DLM61_08940 [Pseudonocardiales bacterium]